MLHNVRASVLRVRPMVIQRAFRRPFAVASAESVREPSSDIPPKSALYADFLDGEPNGPKLVTEFPGPHFRTTKEEMGKIQDVISVSALLTPLLGSSSECHGV